MKIGIMFGSYNPPHKGHISAIESVRREQGLDHVFIVPVKQSPFKTDILQASYEDKMKMCREACSHLEGVSITPFVESSSNSAYFAAIKGMLKTIRDIKEKFRPDKVVLIGGQDFRSKLGPVVQASKLSANPLFEKASHVIAHFNHKAARLVRQKLGAITALNDVEIPDVRREDNGGHSSTAVRKALDSGEDLTDMLHEGVQKYIKDKGLYQ